jgi:broad specificity phosphatase PhoE
MRAVYLLRHGQTEANTGGLVNGTPAHVLTEAGRKQVIAARSLIDRYRLHFDLLYVSHWKRAQETAELFMPSCAFRVDPRLGEHDSGIYANMTWEKFSKDYPQFAMRDIHMPYIGGESRMQLFARVVAWFKEIEMIAPEEASVLAVTHAGPIECLVQYICGTPPERIPVFYAQNASLTMLNNEPGGRWPHDAGGWELKFFSVV